MTIPSWSVRHHGIPILIDDYENMPEATLVAVDLETNAKEVNEDGFKIVCIGISDGNTCWVYFDIRYELIEYLHSVRFIAHEGKRAEIPWLNKVYGGFSIDQLAYDTYTMAYMFDSMRNQYGLKKLLEDIFGVHYPTYSELTHDADVIKAACERQPELYIQKKKGSTLPKELTLDKVDRDIVAEYNSCDTYWDYKLYEYYITNFTAAQWNFFNTIEMPTTRLIYEMEQLGIKINTNEVRRIHNENSKKRRKDKKDLFELFGERFNPNSPKQLLPLLQKAGAKVLATDEETLSDWKHLPVVSKLLEYRGVQKLCSTYTIPLYFNSIKSENSRIHTRFNQATKTGRLSSSDPINLQNQPQATRGAFIPELSNCFINGDLSNIELRLPAHFSGDPGFIEELLRHGGDLHLRTAKQLFGNSISSLPEKERKAKRAIAKEAMLTISNSGTERSLSNTLDCSEKEAKEFIHSVERLYPVFIAWLKAEKAEARRRGGIGTYFGRWVNIPQLTLYCGNPSCAISGRFCKTCFLREEAERTAMSVRVQGTASDMIKLAALRLRVEYGLVPVVSVHDELMYEVTEYEAETYVQIVKEGMENVVEMKVPIIADVSHGINWAEAKGK